MARKSSKQSVPAVETTEATFEDLFGELGTKQKKKGGSGLFLRVLDPQSARKYIQLSSALSLEVLKEKPKGINAFTFCINKGVESTHALICWARGNNSWSIKRDGSVRNPLKSKQEPNGDVPEGTYTLVKSEYKEHFFGSEAFLVYLDREDQ
jgi:hypothetical protein